MSVKVPMMSQEAKYLYRQVIAGMLSNIGCSTANLIVAFSFFCQSQTLGCGAK